MKQNLATDIEKLYQLPLEDFTKARNALAKTLSGSDKKHVTSLAKPSLPMWVINQLYWQEGATYKALVDAAEKLRAAHRSVLSGRQADTRTPDQLHRTTVEKAFVKAIAAAETSGVRLTDAARDTIRRTLAALPSEEPAGRLTRPPEPVGFTLLTGVKVRDTPAKVRQPTSTADKAESQRRTREEIQAQKRADRELARQRKEAERKARNERLAQEKREREIRKAEQALRDAERRLAELKG